MKTAFFSLAIAISFPCIAKTPDVGGVGEIIAEAAFTAKIQIQDKNSDNHCNPRRRNLYKGKVIRAYKLFGIYDEEIEFCTNTDLEIEKEYVIALFCERSSEARAPMSASFDSVFYKGSDGKFRRNISSELKSLLPMDADPALESTDIENILSSRMIRATKISQCD